MNHKRKAAPLLAALAVALVFAFPAAASAQDGGAQQQRNAGMNRQETNHEVQLYLLVASNGPGQGSGVPRQLDAVVRQLKSSLPFGDYRLGATFLNRVMDGGTLEVSGVGISPLVSSQPLPNSPSFYQLTLQGMQMSDDSSGQKIISIEHFRFGLKLPVQTSSVQPDNKTTYPVIQYEDTGIRTELSVREGEPTIVGTLTATRSDEAFVLVIVIKRAGK
jgi:hypothetical protein